MTQTDRRVLHLASGDRWGGAEAQLHTLLTQLNAAGPWVAEAILLNDLELAQRLRDAGVTVTVFAEDQQNMLQLYRAVTRYVDARRPALIHTHRQKENLLGALAARRFGIPSLRTVHGATEHPPRGLRQLHKHALFRLDRWIGAHLQQRLIAVSADLQRQLSDLYPPSRLVTIQNGIDIEAVRRAATVPAALGQAGRHIGIVGRLDPVKRVDLFLEMAAALIAAGHTDWCFHVFGEGKLDAALQQQAAALGIAGQVRFHGHRQDIAAGLAALDALVMCSDHEGLPMTALEAIAVGTPVLAHAVGGLVAVLEQQRGGLLVEDHHPAAYAAGLEQLLAGDPATLIEAGQAHLQRHYSAAANASAVSSLYHELTGVRA